MYLCLSQVHLVLKDTHRYIPNYLYTYLPTYIPIYLPIYLYTYLPIYLYTYTRNISSRSSCLLLFVMSFVVSIVDEFVVFAFMAVLSMLITSE